MKRVNDVLACETFMKKARPVDMPIESNRMPRMVGCLSAIVAAALSACGGANDGESAAMDSVVSARVSAFANSGADGVPDVQLAAAKNAGKGNSGANWAKVADENASFLVGTAQTVRFGVGNKWTTKVVSGKGDCNIAFFGSDPASGSLKECQVSETSGTPLDDSAVAPAPTNTTSTTPTTTTTLTTTTTTAAWLKIAAESQNFTVIGPVNVRYGAGSSWVTKSVSGSGACSNNFFGTDPSIGASKECQLQSSGVAAPPTIDTTKLAASTVGYATARVQAANVADPSQLPTPNDIGAFREPCNFSHMSFDDPIVFPGQPGKSHLHTFFGNTGTNASTTAASLAGSGNSSCAGGTLNRSAYWVPAMIDTRTGAPIKPNSSIFYYKTGYNGISPQAVQPLPAGLRMVSGNPQNHQSASPARYGCVGGADQGWYGSTIPNCSVGSELIMEVIFPQCWDGVNLDSPDHISHMASPSNGACPASHPVPVPVVSFEVHYTITAADAPSRWRLSSDNYDANLPGGLSGHGDWFNGWDTATMATFVKNCEQKSMDCRAYLLGDGRTLY